MNKFEMLSIANDFFDKFGLGPISVDAFDVFIIDTGLAEDPGTDDPKDQAYKGFIQSRATVKNALNNAGKNARTPYQIKVVKSGVEWAIKPFADAATVQAAEVGDRVRLFTRNKVKALEPLKKQAQRLAGSNPDDKELNEAMLMLDAVVAHSDEFNHRIAAQVAHYNTAIDSTQKKIARKIARLEAKNGA